MPARIIKSGKVRCSEVEINCNTESFIDKKEVQIAIRPEDIRFNREGENDNSIIASISEIEFLGAFQRIYFQSILISKEPIIMDIPSSSARKTQLNVGDEMSLYFSEEDTKVYPI